MCCRGATLPSDYLHAIHMVETGGRTGPIQGDNGKALGPFQIHYSYWKDSGVPGKYSECSDYYYSVLVVSAYAQRHEPRAVEQHDYETLARLHNGGPAWRAHKENTDAYWARVKHRLQQAGLFVFGS